MTTQPSTDVLMTQAPLSPPQQSNVTNTGQHFVFVVKDFIRRIVGPSHKCMFRVVDPMCGSGCLGYHELEAEVFSAVPFMKDGINHRLHLEMERKTGALAADTTAEDISQVMFWFFAMAPFRVVFCNLGKRVMTVSVHPPKTPDERKNVEFSFTDARTFDVCERGVKAMNLKGLLFFGASSIQFGINQGLVDLAQEAVDGGEEEEDGNCSHAPDPAAKRLQMYCNALGMLCSVSGMRAAMQATLPQGVTKCSSFLVEEIERVDREASDTCPWARAAIRYKEYAAQVDKSKAK